MTQNKNSKSAAVWYTELVKQAKDASLTANTTPALMDIKASFLGKDGQLTLRLKDLGKEPPELRKELGTLANTAKAEIESAIYERQEAIKREELNRRLSAEEIGRAHV